MDFDDMIGMEEFLEMRMFQRDEEEEEAIERKLLCDIEIGDFKDEG